MKIADFSIIHDKGEVTIVRNQTQSQKKASVVGQSIKVQCFNPSQIDRILRFQEIESRRDSQKPQSTGIKKILHL